jgi:hypothetical protein
MLYNGNRFEIKSLAMNTSSSEFGAVVNQGNFFSGVIEVLVLDKK